MTGAVSGDEVMTEAEATKMLVDELQGREHYVVVPLGVDQAEALVDRLSRMADGKWYVNVRSDDGWVGVLVCSVTGAERLMAATGETRWSMVVTIPKWSIRKTQLMRMLGSGAESLTEEQDVMLLDPHPEIPAGKGVWAWPSLMMDALDVVSPATAENIRRSRPGQGLR